MTDAHRPMTSARAVPGVRAVLVLVLLLATIWQSCLLGAHNHFRTSPISVAGIDTQFGKAPTPSRDTPLPADTCPLCQAAAHGGTYLPPAPAVIAPPAPSVAWYVQTDFHRIIERQRSHDWRSRAPPTALQT